MSEFVDLLPRGQGPGISVLETEMELLAYILKAKYQDMFVPLPKSVCTLVQQLKRIGRCRHNAETMDNTVYYETETGGHGWCCEKCGEVLQWG